MIQAGVVYGGVYVGGSDPGSPPPLIPRQLVAPPAPFAGRQRELALLTEFLDTDRAAPAVAVLRGPGGVGKTALALRWLADVAHRFPAGQLYADLTLATGEPVAAEDLLGQFLRALGVPPRDVPPGFAERAALYRSATAGKAVAVLLDDAVSAAQARVLLPASPGSLAVVTTRRPLLGLLAVGAFAMAVDPLDPDGALELLTHGIGSERVQAERAAATRLAELCGGLPIALCVTAARAATRPKRRLARIADELGDERRRLDALSADEDLSVRSTFDVAYAHLPDDQRTVYRALGWHPGRTFDAAGVAAAIGSDSRTAQRYLDDLADASLVEELDYDRYRLHDLVRLHALHLAAMEDGDNRLPALHRTLEWYLFSAQAAGRAVMPARRVLSHPLPVDSAGFVLPAGIGEHAAALHWLERTMPNLMAATHDAAGHGWFELAYHLADALQPLFIVQSHERAEVEIDEVGLRAAQAWGNQPAEYSMRKRLARAYYRLGQFDRAEQHATTMLHRARIGRDRRAEASALKTTALAHVAQRRFADAVAVFRESLVIVRMLGRRRAEALTLIELGTTLATMGDADGAVIELRAARQLVAGLEPPDPYQSGRVDAALGQACLAAGRYDDARDLLQAAVVTLAGQRADHARARAHAALAELARRTGDEEGARQHQETAEALRRPGLPPNDALAD